MATDERIDYYEKIKEYEKKLISDALIQTRGHQARAAQLLGLSPTTLSSQLQRLGINARSFKPERDKVSFRTFEKFYLWKSDRSCQT